MRVKVGQLVSIPDGRRKSTMATVVAKYGDSMVVRPLGESHVLELDVELDIFEVIL